MASRLRGLTSLLSRSLQSAANRSTASPLSSRSLWAIDFRVPRSSKNYSSLHNKELDDINSKFAEAREEIELALESKETVYFDEEAETARVAVQEVLDKYEALIAKLSAEEKGVVQRSMGLKIEQLKAELAQLKE